MSSVSELESGSQMSLLPNIFRRSEEARQIVMILTGTAPEAETALKITQPDPGEIILFETPILAPSQPVVAETIE